MLIIVNFQLDGRSQVFSEVVTKRCANYMKKHLALCKAIYLNVFF